MPFVLVNPLGIITVLVHENNWRQYVNIWLLTTEEEDIYSGQGNLILINIRSQNHVVEKV
jgi:hypothetical protein